MRIGKNELEIMKLIAEEGGKATRAAIKSGFKQHCDDDHYRSVALSRALYSLTEKGLVMKYARIRDLGEWEFDEWDHNEYGHRIMWMKKPYDGKMEDPHTPAIEQFLGLTGKGEKELEKRT